MSVPIVPWWQNAVTRIAQFGKKIRISINPNVSNQPKLSDKNEDPVGYYLMKNHEPPKNVPYFQQKLPSNPNLTKGDFWLGLLIGGAAIGTVFGIIFVSSKKKRNLFPNYIETTLLPIPEHDSHLRLKKVGLPDPFIQYLRIVQLTPKSTNHIWSNFKAQVNISSWSDKKIENELNDFTLASVAHYFSSHHTNTSEISRSNSNFVVLSDNIRHFSTKLKQLVGNFEHYPLEQFQSINPNQIILLDANILIGYNSQKQLVDKFFNYAISQNIPIWILTQILNEISI